MKNFNFLCVISFLSFYITSINCYYIYQKNNTVRNGNEDVISLDGITISEANGSEGFPLEFKCEFESFGHKFVYKFELFKDDVASRNDIFINNPSDDSKVIRYETDNEIEHQFYKSNEDAIATLIVNKDLNQHNISSEIKFRALITILNHQSGDEYDVVPLVIEKRADNKMKRENTRDGLFQAYLVTRRRNAEIKKIDLNLKDKSKRGSPKQLYVEYLVAADSSVLLKHQQILNTNNVNMSLLHMKIFYSHLTNAVNQRYTNSLEGDTELQLGVKLANFYFQTSQVSWTDPNVVGDANYPTYKGKEVLVTTKTLAEFTSYMNNLLFPFNYDHAVGFFNKDLWNDRTSDSAASRSGVIGYASIGTICTINRYSICEDLGFNSITLAAHELAHNLGAIHDGDSGASACSQSDNYIMTPSIGFYKINLQNLFKFSPCTIKQFKANLLTNSPTCLTDIPTNETPYVNSILPGQLWNADFQCKLITGINGSVSSRCNQPNICIQLWCSDGTTGSSANCTSTPGWGALDGTSCGTNKVCMKGDCVDDTTPQSNAVYSCSSNPCLNSGVCIQISQFFMCSCPEGYYGFTCEIGNQTTTTKQQKNQTTTTLAIVNTSITTAKPATKITTTNNSYKLLNNLSLIILMFFKFTIIYIS